MKTEAKLALAIGGVLLAVIVGASFLLPGKDGKTVATTGTTGAMKPSAETPVIKSPSPATAAPLDLTGGTSSATTATARLNGFGDPQAGATTQPGHSAAGPSVTLSGPTTQPAPYGSGPTGATTQPTGLADGPTGTGMTPTGPTGEGTVPGGVPGGSPGTTDWKVLLSGASTGTPTPGGAGPSAGARTGTTPPGSSLKPLTPTPSPASGTTGTSLSGATSSGGASSVGSTYVVAKGDTLSSISSKVYGNANLWSKIAQANPDANSNRLKVGQVLKIPAQDQAKPTDSAAPKHEGVSGSALVRDPKTEYQVQPGDSLAKIAQKLYGAGSKWESIYDANKDLIGSSPTKLKVGMILKLPTPPTTTRAS